MVTKTTQVARSVMLESGKGSFLFNDKLVDGRRSLKVWGWTSAEYLAAKSKLEAQGCKVNMVKAPVYHDHRGARTVQNTRLHVTE